MARLDSSKGQKHLKEMEAKRQKRIAQRLGKTPAPIKPKKQ
jgi:hypothetical protein